ncbi:hypothetical protein DFH27DRAFT_345371 [Peziza echinospora]|nr:hypothetical protein DFH27DRAFT_345371 [Peziza echinospora]
MRLHCPWRPSPAAALVLLALCVFAGGASGGAVHAVRQESGGAATGTALSTSTRLGQTTGQGTPTLTPGAGPLETRTTSTASTTSLASDGPIPSMTRDKDWEEAGPNNIPIYSGKGLPIMPSVTPGIAIAGVLLMLAGLPYCLVGIKNKRVQIFLSTGFLCVLGVTVLIVYVMNPPVPNAIEGAYVVAATLTGVFFGAVAVIFPEVTQTLGCILGGFCLSMWFLVLKPGGLITSTYGKLIMMAAFCLGVFSLAFHRSTRPYALIVSTAFSGATSIVLGIDCFAKAGLKEFWLYIWNLNDKMFPLETHTFPHTRGMRVEIAGILLITAFGIMSQMKLWKILKERRDVKRAEQQRAVEDVEKLNEDVGRRVEEQDREERAKWERVYGNAIDEEGTVKESRPTSAIASRTDSRVTLTELEPIGMGKGSEVIEITEIKKGREHQTQMIRMQPIVEATQQDFGDATETAESRLSGQSMTISEQPPTSAYPVEDSPRESSDALPSTPVPILMRQHVPYIPDDKDCEYDAMSLATCADTIQENQHPEMVQIIGSSTDLPAGVGEERGAGIAMAHKNAPKAAFTETHVGSIEVDRQSIISTKGKNIESEYIQNEVSLEGQTKDTETLTVEAVVANQTSEVDSSDGILPQPSTEDQKVSSATSGEKPPSSPASFADFSALQNHCSRIHKTYRTNEWAKHLASADAVELDDLTSSPYVDPNVPAEESAPVMVTELQESAIPRIRSPSSTKLVATPVDELEPPAPLTFTVAASQSIPTGAPQSAPPPPPQALIQPTQQVQLIPTGTLPPTPPPHTPSPPPHLANLISHGSANPLANFTNNTSGYYTPASTPSPPPIATSPPHHKSTFRQNSIPPIPEGAVLAKGEIVRVASPPPLIHRATSPVPPIPYENTLMGKRESMLKSRPSFGASETMNRAASPHHIIRAASPTGPTRTNSPIGMIRAASPPGFRPVAEPPSMLSMNLNSLSNADDMTLSERRELLQQQLALQQSLAPQLTPRNSFSPSPPSPTTVVKQDGLLQSWRQSLKQDHVISQHQQSNSKKAERRALEVLNEKQQAEIHRKEKEAEKAHRDSLFEERMRRPDMLNAHREALRRLQAGASTGSPS